MKLEEAIKILKRDLKIQKENKCLSDGIEAIEIAIQALEKQAPKKPQMRHIKHFDGYNDGWCPCCESYVQETEYDTFFCQKCGQKLDWGEEE